MLKISRRKILQATAGIGAFGLVGAGWVFTGNGEQYVAGALKKYLGEIPMEPDAISLCSAEFVNSSSAEQRGKIDKLAKLSRMIGVNGVHKLLDDWSPYDTFRRRIVTYFLINSSYFQRETESELVTFNGNSIGCGNPFARFD